MSDASSYLRYLPGIYARQPDGFMGGFLAIFQKILTGIRDGELDGRKGMQELLAANVIGNLFYPRLSFLFPDDTQLVPPIDGKHRQALLAELDTYIGAEPPTDALRDFLPGSTPNDPQAGITAWLEDFLAWLAGWVDVVLDSDWSLDKKRMVIAQIMALHRLRGTAQGTKLLLDLLLDMPRMVDGFRVVDGRRIREQRQASLEVVNPSPPDILVTDAVTSRSFVLQGSVSADMPVVSGYTHGLFIVRILLPTAIDGKDSFLIANFAWLRTILRKLPTVLEAAKPALTRWSLEIIPSMRLPPADAPTQLVLASNTLLGSQPPP